MVPMLWFVGEGGVESERAADFSGSVDILDLF